MFATLGVWCKTGCVLIACTAGLCALAVFHSHADTTGPVVLSMEYMETLTGGDLFCDIDCETVGDCNSRNGLTGTSECSPTKEDCAYCENFNLGDNTCTKVTWFGYDCVVTTPSSCGVKYINGKCKLEYMGYRCAGTVPSGTCTTDVRNCEY